jgi:hypothetical protein
MKKRLVSGWNVRRLLYLVMGVIVIAQSIADHQNWGILLGAYFAVMGIFNLGCASGYCGVPLSSNKQYATKAVDTEYEEVKK